MQFRLLTSTAKLVAFSIGINALHMGVAQAEGQYIGEIRAFPYYNCPRDWVEADGRSLSIADYMPLFSLLTTSYGGDGRTSFKLPDLRGRVAMGEGTGPGLQVRRLGEHGGLESLSMAGHEVPAHTHNATTSTVVHAYSATGTSTSPSNNLLADDGRDRIYSNNPPDVVLSANSGQSSTVISAAGSTNPEPFTRRQPSVAVRMCIAVNGVYPQPG